MFKNHRSHQRRAEISYFKIENYNNQRKGRFENRGDRTQEIIVNKRKTLKK